jgi:thiol-disulfide isomerase/thioredoxin
MGHAANRMALVGPGLGCEYGDATGDSWYDNCSIFHRIMGHLANALRTVLFFAVLATSSCIAADGSAMRMRPVPGNLPTPPTRFSDGKNVVGLEAFRGKYVLVNFWATWCSPCVREMPALDRLASKLAKNLVVVAVSQDEGGAVQVRPFLEKLNVRNLHIVYDTDKKSFRDYGLRGLPTTVLISPRGILVARLEGEATWDVGLLAKQVEDLIGVAGEK